MTQANPGLGALSDAERYFFDLYGYIVRYGALDDDELATINGSIDALRIPPPGTTIESQRFHGFLTDDRLFRSLIDHDAICEPIVELCGPYARLDHAYGIQMAPGSSGLGLHGGGTPHDPSQFYEVSHDRIYNGLVAVQWALVDHHPGDGGFRCIPGSHRANFSLPAEVPSSWVVDIALQAGDVVIFTEALTHGTSPWRGTTDRRTLLYKYAPGHMAWSVQYHTTMAEVLEHGDLTARQRRFLQPPGISGHQSILG